MGEQADAGPVPVPWWRLLGIGALLVALYFGIRAVSPHQTDPVLLVPAIVLGGAIGLLAGRREAALLSSPARTGHRGRRSRRAMSKSATRSYVVGLTGAGLILAQALSASAMEWVMLGAVVLMAGGAGHAWVMARHYETDGAGRAD